MKTIILAILLLTIPISGFSLSHRSKISVLTSEPGNEYATIFGHSSIRVIDDSLGIDDVFNFGSFDFNEPFFYLKFVKGNLKYFLSVVDYNTFMRYAYTAKQKIHEQVLNMSLIERNNVFDKLMRCYNSSDRYYRYDFFYDNCATRVRDVILGSTEKAVRLDSSQYKNKSFRQLLKPYITDNYWINFGINFILGRECDKIATTSDYMFLPFYIMDILQKAPLVKEHKIIAYGSLSKNDSNWSYLFPWLITAMILLLSLWNKSRKIVFYTVITTVGLSGLILLTIGIITVNPAFSHNLNICWTLPSLVLLLVRNKRIGRIISITYIILLFIVLLLWNYLPQDFSVTFIPWMLSIIIVLLSGNLPTRSRKS